MAWEWPVRRREALSRVVAVYRKPVARGQVAGPRLAGVSELGIKLGACRRFADCCLSWPGIPIAYGSARVGQVARELDTGRVHTIATHGRQTWVGCLNVPWIAGRRSGNLASPRQRPGHPGLGGRPELPDGGTAVRRVRARSKRRKLTR